MREIAVKTQITWIAEVPPEVPEHTSLDSLMQKKCMPTRGETPMRKAKPVTLVAIVTALQLQQTVL